MAGTPFSPLALSDINSGSIGWFDDPSHPKSPQKEKHGDSEQFRSVLSKPPRQPPAKRQKQRIPSSFTSSYKIHEMLMASSNHNENLSVNLVQALDRWVVCMMVVQFDVEIGPDMKIIQPAVQFTEEDFRAICFSSLPERSSSKETRSQFHSFRFDSTTFPGTELHGYALFSQQKSLLSSRGYTQESVVLISRLDFPQLFNACLQLMVDVVDHNREFNTLVQDENDQIYSQVRRQIHNRDGYEDDAISLGKRKLSSGSANQMLDEKLPVIHTAISNISQWPDPEPNSTLELGFLGTIINLSIPLYPSMPLIGTVNLETSEVNFHRGPNMASKFSASTSDLSSFSCDPKLYTPHDAPVITATEPSTNWDYLIGFMADVSDLYILYEYMLLAKPIVVYASSPHQCSTFISLLVDFIRPIPYAGRIREYVTINSCPSDMDNGIIGVTNPFLIRGIQKPDTLVIVLSPNKDSGKKGNGSASVPFHYYRTYHNGVGILRRQTVLRQSQSLTSDMSLASPIEKEKPDVVMSDAPALAVPSRQQASWTSKLFSRYIPSFGSNDRLRIEKSSISKPITSTFAKLPTSFNAFGANITKTHKKTQSNISEWESEQVNREEEAKIKNSMRTARRTILKNRLLFPDQKFLASLNRLISQAQSASYSAQNVPPEKSIDFAIRFHFATLTARFLSPLACYLDPIASEKEELPDQPKLAFAQDEFVQDLVSPNASPRRRDSFRVSRGNSVRRRRSVAPNMTSSASPPPPQNSSSNTTEPASSIHSVASVGTTVIQPSSPARVQSPQPLLYAITSRDQVKATTPPPGTTTSTTIATATAPLDSSNAAAASGHSINLLRNLSRKSLGGSKSGSTTSLLSTSPPPTSALGGRSSMLSLSSLGLRFSQPAAAAAGESSYITAAPDERDDVFRCSSPPPLPLQPPMSPKRRSKRFSGRFSLAPLEAEPPSELEDASPTSSPSANLSSPPRTAHHVKKIQQQTADLHKQAIYKTFIDTPNFSSWLQMNNVSLALNKS